MKKDYNDPRNYKKPGYLNQATYAEAKRLRHQLIVKENLQSPFRPIDCWLVMTIVDEKFEGGIVLNEHEYSKERERLFVVLAAGPGWRVCKGLMEKNVETGQVVPTLIKRGDIVQCVERLAQPITWTDDRTYHLVEGHKVLFGFEEE